MAYFTPSELAMMSPEERRMAELDALISRGNPGIQQAQIAQQVPQQQGGGGLGAAVLGGVAANEFLGGGGAAMPELVGPAPELVGPVLGTSTAAASPLALSGFGTAGNVYAPAIGAMLAADVLMNKKHGAGGAAEGALAGAGLGAYFGPWGALAGAGIGGGIGYFGNFGDEDRYLTEYNKAQALRDSGIDWKWNTEQPTKGRSLDELIALAQATGDPATIKFASSRNEDDLTPNQTAGYSIWGEKYGNDYAKASLDRQLAANQAALTAGALREHHGTVDANEKFTSALDEEIKKILKGEANSEAKK